MAGIEGMGAPFLDGIALPNGAAKVVGMDGPAYAAAPIISAKVEDALPELLKKFSPEKTSVILDPPRKGCWPETLRLLRETRPAQIIYVSCHPATMARDLNILCADGVFELARVQPLDMFPQTQHVECVADLRAGQNLAKPPNMDSTGSTHGDVNTN